MKKIFFILFVIIVLFLSGCSNQPESKQIIEKKEINLWQEPAGEPIENKYCEKLEKSKKICYYELARYTGKIGFCKKLPQDMWASKLYRLKCIAVATRDKSYCDRMVPTDEKQESDYCKFYIDQTINYTLDSNLNGCSTNYNCITAKVFLHNLEIPKTDLYKAIANNDETYCESIKDKTYNNAYADCIIGLALKGELT